MSETTTEISVEALRRGDRAEFARMVEAYSGPIHRLALKMLAHPQDAEDVLQNTFLKALQHIRGFEGRSSLSTWLYRIAANEALMLIRRQRPETPLADLGPDADDNEDFAPANLSDWCCLPEQELLTSESRARLDQAIRRLPEKLRIVFLLRDIEGLSIAETGQTLDLSETAVKTRLLRARLRLRDDLGAYYGERLGERKK
ncbi:MAG: RNA polymerase sigma-70 factor ECF subfamily [Anaerolineaceae bacterium]|nr:MAG: RNA polymerase sigma-70 factor ECF subfamily [Anaerolineaceae bacterium]